MAAEKIIKMKQQLVLLGVFLLILGCNRNAEYRLPHPPIPRSFPSQTADFKEIPHVSYQAWWTKLEDKQLNTLIQQGLQKNLDLKITWDRLDRARGELKQVQFSWIPSAQLLAGYSTNPGFGTPGAFYGIWAFYAINIAKLVTEGDVARFGVQYHCAMVDGMRLTVIGQIAAAYFTLLAQKEQIAILEGLSRELQTLIRFYRDDIRFGLKNDLDITVWQVKENYIQAQLETLQHNMTLSQNALRFLLDENPGKIKADRAFQSFDFTLLKPGSLPASVLRNRPDVRMAAYAAKRAKASVLSAYANFFPVMQLDQFLGQATWSKRSLAELSDSYLDAAIIPSNLGVISAQKGTYHGAIHDYLKTIKNSLKEVDNAFSANRHYQKYFELAKTAEQDYKEKYGLQMGLVKTGLLSERELLESKIIYDELAVLTSQSRLQLALTLVLLYQDLAGGYKADTETNRG